MTGIQAHSEDSESASKYITPYCQAVKEPDIGLETRSRRPLHWEDKERRRESEWVIFCFFTVAPSSAAVFSHGQAAHGLLP